jgi:hypothetical protein
MIYEISKEMFKQKLHKPVNFKFVHLAPSAVEHDKFNDFPNIPFDGQFLGKFKETIGEKESNILLFNFSDREQLEKATEALKNDGYLNVYFFAGSQGDELMADKIN